MLLYLNLQASFFDRHFCMIPVEEFQFFNESHIHAVKTAAVKTAAVKTAAVDNGGFTNTYYYTYDANGNMTRRSGGSPQQQTLLVKGYKGEIAGQMTDLSATLLTSADIELDKLSWFDRVFTERWFDFAHQPQAAHQPHQAGSRSLSGVEGNKAEGTVFHPFTKIFHSFKHFVNTHIVASPAFLYAGHSSLDYILSYNSFSWKAKTGAFLILLMILYIFLYKYSGHIQNEEEYSSARFFRLTSPAVTMGFLMTFVLQSCTGLSHHSSQTPWAALGAAAINANTPAIGDVPGFGTPGEGGSSHAGASFA